MVRKEGLLINGMSLGANHVPEVARPKPIMPFEQAAKPSEASSLQQIAGIAVENASVVVDPVAEYKLWSHDLSGAVREASRHVRPGGLAFS